MSQPLYVSRVRIRKFEGPHRKAWIEPFEGGRMEDVHVRDHPGVHRYTDTRGIPELVEVVRGMETSNKTVLAVREFAEQLGKVPSEVNDSPGFVVNRVLFPMINEAAFALGEGVSDAHGIDECMKGGCNHPMGPLALADLVGLDVVCAILRNLHSEFGNPRYAPSLEIVKRVEAGWLGRKSGRGFYDYS